MVNSVISVLRDFFETGGPVLWPIFGFTLLMWGLILERYWYFWVSYPHVLASFVNEWQQRQDTQSWYAQQIRMTRVSELTSEMGRFVPVVKTLVASLPMLGLLGTVTGMIQIFDVMAMMGTGNPRAMADGVSRATIPTMSGLVAALSGLYFSINLDYRVKTEHVRLINEFGVQ